ncbi:MAG: lipopolysaccharide biosynthesis protein [Bacteroidales bacterium 43_36]|jgi:O-antigen/teichoic acid export membrane protein|nr:MAG: lipopolysaccharide biosynthesis protein [Bacteroidales bacterium 43_36]
MSELIKNKAIRGVAWSAVEKFARQGLMALFTILIARQLSPSDYGLVAMLTILLAIAQIFVDSGFVEALIQKQDRTEIDFSTTFWFNIGVALVIYSILFISAPLVASFYKEPLLKELLIWLSLLFVINSFRTVQQAKLNIAMNFRRQAWISVIAISASGGVGLWMAYHSFGVWTLVWQQLLQNFLNVVLLWISAEWKPTLIFSKDSFKELFNFGSKLLISRTVDAIYSSGSFLLIGKFFSPTVTGLYSQSIQMTSLMPQTITDIIARVAYPIECELQDKEEELQQRFFQMLRMACFVLFPLMMGLAALVEPVVRLLLTEKWMAVCPLIQILCFAWIWRPASHMNWQLLNAKHRSDYCLKAEIIKKSIAIVLLVIMLFFGIKAVCFGVLAYFIVDVYVMTCFTRRILSQVTFMEEMRNLLPILLQAMLMGVLVHFLKYLIYSDLLLIVSGIFVGITLYAGISIVSGSVEIRMLWGEIRKRNR